MSLNVRGMKCYCTRRRESVSLGNRAHVASRSSLKTGSCQRKGFQFSSSGNHPAVHMREAEG